MNCARIRRGAFTIVELMVTVAILSLVLLILSSITDATRRTWIYTSGKVEQFRAARDAFEAMTRKLSQATLNTYWDYDSLTAPSRYLRQSELRFISGGAAELTARGNATGHAIFFQAPLGYAEDSARYGDLQALLNTWGYFVEFGDDAAFRPPFVTEEIVPYRHRFRLCEMMEPADRLSIYRYTNGQPSYNGRQWFTEPLNASPSNVRVLAENIISLIVLPRLAPQEDPSGTKLAPAFSYDSTATGSDPSINSKNQLPPVVQISVVAVEEASFNRFLHGRPTGATSLSSDLGLLFQQPGDLEDPAKPGLAQDMERLGTILRDNRIGHRAFTTNVSIKGAKWSRAQDN